MTHDLAGTRAAPPLRPHPRTIAGSASGRSTPSRSRRPRLRAGGQGLSPPVGWRKALCVCGIIARALFAVALDGERVIGTAPHPACHRGECQRRAHGHAARDCRGRAGARVVCVPLRRA